MDREEANPLYDQLVCIHETCALFVEQAEESFSVSISHLDWDSLSEDQREAVHEWHKSLRIASQVIRGDSEEVSLDELVNTSIGEVLNDG
tara:strand:+ start:227 stop:496 length:270 start_codon:yes stop_codon:yes gene_type:complete